MELTFDAKKKQKTKPLHTQQKQNKKIEKETKEAKKKNEKNGANAINNSFARDFVKSVHNWIILLTTKIVLA